MQPQNQIGEGTFPRSRAADDRGGLTGSQGERQIADHRFFRAFISESDMIEDENRFRLCGGGCRNQSAVADCRPQLEQFTQPAQTGTGFGKGRHDRSGHDQISHGHHGIFRHGADLSEGHCLTEHQSAADAQDQRHQCAHHQPDDRIDDGKEPVQPDHRVCVIAISAARPLFFIILIAERTDYPHPGYRFPDDLINSVQANLDAAGERFRTLEDKGRKA